MLRPMAITVSGALLLTACGSEGSQEPSTRSVAQTPAAYSPPDNPQAPPANPQAPPANDNAPDRDPSEPPENPQGPTARPPRPAGGTLAPQVVQTCRSLCEQIDATCRGDCNVYCDLFSLIPSKCTTAAVALLACYRREGADCDSRDLDLAGRCRGEVVESVQVSDDCHAALFPGNQ